MTREEYDKIKEAIEGAETSTTPFPILDDNEMIVAGDANETEIKKSKFTMHFRVPIEEKGKRKLVIKTVEYDNLYITPRQDIKIVQLITELMPYFRKANPDGTVTEHSEQELWTILTEMDQEIYDLMYELAGMFLGVDKTLRDFMLPGDVLDVIRMIFSEYSEVVNESDTFFG